MTRTALLPLASLLLSLALGCDAVERPPILTDDASRASPLATDSEHAWIVPESDAPAAVNPEFSVDDTVILDELDLPNGARAQIIEIPENGGVGVIWLGAPPEISGLPAPDYSPLELSRAFGSAHGPLPELAENHERLAAEGRVPVEARDLLSLGTTTDPSQATFIDERRLCPLGSPSAWFNAFWGYYKQTCPNGTLCGSPSNDQTGAATGNFYIVALASSKTALQTCNGGYPLGSYSTDSLNAQLQYYGGSGNWYSFYTSPAYATEEGVVFSTYGFTTNQYRMRIYNANSNTYSLAAAIW